MDTIGETAAEVVTEVDTEVAAAEVEIVTSEEKVEIVAQDTVAAEAALPRDRKDRRGKLQEAEAERGNERTSHQ